MGTEEMRTRSNNKKPNNFTKFNYIILLIVFIALTIKFSESLTGNFGGNSSALSCGANCNGAGYELSGHDESYCNSNPVECFNTIDECEDGSKYNYEYLHEIVVTSLNNSIFQAGDTININVTAAISTGGDGIFIVYTNESKSSNVDWKIVRSVYDTGSSPLEINHYYVNITLDNRVGNHSIRAIVEYKQQDNLTCGKGAGADYPTYSDTDDVTLYVEKDNRSPILDFSSSSPANDFYQTASSVTINVTHIEFSPDSLILNWNSTNDTTTSYSGSSTTLTKTNLGLGTHTYFVWANDTYGNTNTTQTRNITIYNISPNIISPIEGGNYSFSNVSLNYSISSTGPYNISKCWYNLNSGSNVSLGNCTNITLTEGLGIEGDNTNSLFIYSNDTAGNIGFTNLSFYVDVSVPSITPNAVTNPLELGNNQTFNITIGGEDRPIKKAYAEINYVNYTMVEESTYVYTFNEGFNSTGIFYYRFYVNDSADNNATSSLYNFTIQDTTPPSINNLTYSPNTDDDIDPNKMINVTVTIMDLSNVTNVTLQYKEADSSTWTNKTMVNVSPNIYNSNFTPNTANNWTFRIAVRDLYNNTNTSYETNISVALDWSWTRVPGEFSTVAAILNNNVTVGNLVINNTGDYNLTFSISKFSGTPNVYFNESLFNLTNKSVREVKVITTAPTIASSYDMVLKIDALQSNASPSLIYTNSTLQAITNGSFLDVDIVVYDSSVTQGDTISNISATIRNIGNITADNISLDWTLPSGWSSRNNLNVSLDNLTVSSVYSYSIEVDVSSSASLGSKTLRIDANWTDANYSGIRTNYDSKTVTVNSASEDETPSGTTGGGGGGGGGTASAAVRQYIAPDYNIKIDAPEKIEVGIEKTTTLIIPITNTVENTVIKNAEISVDGYLQTLMTVKPVSLGTLEAGKTKNVELSINVPKYMKYKNYTLTFKVSGDASDTKLEPGDTRSDLFYTEKIQSNLIILEIDKSVAISKFEESKTILNEMKNLGLSTSSIADLIREAEDALAKGNYKLVEDIHKEIVNAKEKAVYVSSLIKEAEAKIEDARLRNIDVISAEQILSLAQKRFEKGDYDQAEELANKALLSTVISLSAKRLGFIFKLWNLIKQNILLSLLAVLLISVSGVVVNRIYASKIIKGKLEDLEESEKSIKELMKKTQLEYFKDRIMSSRMYSKIMSGHKSRLAKIQQLKVNLKVKRKRIFKIARSLISFEEEQAELKKIMSMIQIYYFKHGRISKDTYERMIREYKAREAVISEKIALLKRKIHKDNGIKKKKNKNITATELLQDMPETDIHRLRELVKIPKPHKKRLVEIKETIAHDHELIKSGHKELKKNMPIESKVSPSSIKKKIEQKTGQKTEENSVKKIEPIKPVETEERDITKPPKTLSTFKKLEKELKEDVKDSSKKEGIEEEFEDFSKDIKDIEQTLKKEVNTELYRDVSENNVFILNDGRKIRNLHELKESLKTLDDNSFSLYINNEKNDFYNWIKTSIKNKYLAEKIQNIKDKNSLINILEEYEKNTVFA